MAHYEYTFRGKKIGIGQYIFSTENFVTDEEGNASVLLDPKHPRLIKYILTDMS